MRRRVLLALTGLLLAAIAWHPRASAQGQDVQVIVGAPPAPAPGAAPLGPMAFEVASVKPNNSGAGNMQIGIQPGGRFTVTNVPLRQLIVFAYLLQNFQLVGAPDWTRDERFDILAKAEGNIQPTPLGTVGPIQMMVRSLLAERFQLAVHEEKREMPIYALVHSRSDGRLGPQIQRSTAECTPPGRGGPPPAPTAPGERPRCGMMGGLGQLRAGSMTMGDLARTLSAQVQRVVVDKTGLTDRYDFDLTYTPDQLPQGPAPPGAPPLPAVDPNGPSIFTALQEQLGLKLEAQRGLVDVVVVDRVERPTPD
ncbi:MAG: TIGR03435 family protein [Acidobacteria bacterium]|nr:TIGR03435 family protein [Acidobacteriota bacterium]